MEVPASSTSAVPSTSREKHLPVPDWTQQTSNGTKFRGMGLQVAATLPVRPLSSAVVPLYLVVVPSTLCNVPPGLIWASAGLVAPGISHLAVALRLRVGPESLLYLLHASVHEQGADPQACHALRLYPERRPLDRTPPTSVRCTDSFATRQISTRKTLCLVPCALCPFRSLGRSSANPPPQRHRAEALDVTVIGERRSGFGFALPNPSLSRLVPPRRSLPRDALAWNDRVPLLRDSDAAPCTNQRLAASIRRNRSLRGDIDHRRGVRSRLAVRDSPGHAGGYESH